MKETERREGGKAGIKARRKEGKARKKRKEST